METTNELAAASGQVPQGLRLPTQWTMFEDRAPLGSWELDAETKEFRGSEGLFRIFDFVPCSGALPFNKVREVILAADRDHVEAILNTALRTQEPFDIEHRIVRRDDAVRIVRNRGQLVSGGGPLRLV